MKLISDTEIARTLKPYTSEVTAPICDQIRAYVDLLLRWNRRMSLTTVTDPLEILRFHFGESLLAVSAVPIRHGRLADVGSGVGFPAIPIRMASQGMHLTLIESNHKKTAFLAEVVRELALSNVEIYPGRMEDMESSKPALDFVTARAVAVADHFLAWTNVRLKPGGCLVLWLGNEDSIRISEATQWKWRGPIRIPNSNRRVILVGSKNGTLA